MEFIVLYFYFYASFSYLMNHINFNNHFRDLFENSNDLIYFLKVSGEIELVNPSWLSTLEYTFEEVAGKSIYEFIHPDYVDKFRNSREAAVANNEIKEIEFAFISSRNEPVTGVGQTWCSYVSGVPQYTRGVFKNMTLNQLAEKKVRESERRLQAFLSRGPDAVIIINESQEIIEWNSKSEEIFGFSFEEIRGKTLANTIIPPKYRQAHLRGMHHFLTSGDGPILNKTVEITALHKNGKEFFINLSISNVRMDDGWLFIAFLSDISKRKETEEMLIKKEAELLQSKLLQEKKDQFISIASHELKTPITTIKAYTQLTLAMCNDEQKLVKSNLAKIDQYTNKLTFLLNELLDVSKINLGILNLSKTKIDFHKFLNDTLNILQQITTHKIILEQNDEVFVTADMIRLEQVIANLVSNCAKYSPGKNEIIVRSEKRENEVICSFTDFGIGISPENLQKVFDRFFRVDESSLRFSGFGIGLFVSRQIINQHGGKIWVDSEEEKGSTFSFSLPL